MDNNLDNLIKHLGMAIIKRRRELGLSQAELAKAAGIHRTYVSDVENGKRNFSLGTLCSVADSLGISVEQLVARADPQTEVSAE